MILFCYLEEEYLLNSENEIHVFALHYVYLTRINQALQQFSVAWNEHNFCLLFSCGSLVCQMHVEEAQIC